MPQEPLNESAFPEPHSSVAGYNNTDRGSAKPSLLAEKWKPKDAPVGETPVSTLARFAGRLIDRATGKAYSADELTQLIGSSSMGYMFHDADADAARPTDYASVRWVGSVPPNNAITNDIWDDTSV